MASYATAVPSTISLTASAVVNGTTSPLQPPPPEGLTTTLYSPTALLASPHLPQIAHLVNAAFAGSHIVGSLEHLPKDIIRLDAPEQLGDEVGPEGFTIVLFAHAGGWGTPIATASAKPWKANAGDGGVGSETVRLFKRKSAAAALSTTTNTSSNERDSLPKWEILIMAVDPAHRKRGLATYLINAVIQEIKYRVYTLLPSINNPRQEKIVLLLTTMKEMNETYYVTKGFVTTSERRFEKGAVGSREGFSVVEMEGVF